MRRRGFTLIEILVVLAIIMILMGILLGTIEHARHQAYIADCASNLRQIGQALELYAGANHGNYPRTTYVAGAPLVEDSGAAAADPFGPGGPSANDITAPLFLLMRAEKLPPVILYCPYNDVNAFEPEPANPQTHSNFTDYKKNLGYSYANPYPDQAAALAGYRLGTKCSAEFAVAADLNPGVRGVNDDVNAPSLGSPTALMKKANSDNHEKDGQNVLYGDGHVDWKKTCFAGMTNDNIYNNKSKQVEASPVDNADSVLLPSD
jgi:prepilin-type N-terminal cleavage/methylation domain-containing protein/prepilin-type processing-associated H-X9-DG protein